MKLEESWCYKNSAFSSEDFTLKSKQNKKDQTFVGMLIFESFFCCRQLIEIQKKDLKNKHPNKHLALVVLPELYSSTYVKCS